MTFMPKVICTLTLQLILHFLLDFGVSPTVEAEPESTLTGVTTPVCLRWGRSCNNHNTAVLLATLPSLHFQMTLNFSQTFTAAH